MARTGKKAANATCPNFEFENRHRAAGRIPVGLDEVGRGCLAGPVVAAAVVLPEESSGHAWFKELNDSKLLRPKVREELALEIHAHAFVHIAWCLPEEIDQYNILHASLIAMRRAVTPFVGLVQAALVDGNVDPFLARYRCGPGLARRLGLSEVELLVKGDSRSVSIAAASIVAKVYRDRWMDELDRVFPGYGFGDHKGYSTPKHYEAITKLGPCALHRRSFAPFKHEACSESPGGKETNLDLFEGKRLGGQGPSLPRE